MQILVSVHFNVVSFNLHTFSQILVFAAMCSMFLVNWLCHFLAKARKVACEYKTR